MADLGVAVGYRMDHAVCRDRDVHGERRRRSRYRGDIRVIPCYTLVSGICAVRRDRFDNAQRMRKIDRVLTKRQLVISFGFVVFGSLTAAAASMGSVFVDVLWHYETGVCFIAQCLMYAGGLICFAFGYPIFKSFKKR